MERTNLNLPDAINCSLDSNFTQIPNEFLKNPNITAKAKVILGILLSNQKGWKSYIETIKTMMPEQNFAIRAGIKELETFGYLKRVRYRDRLTKKFKGSFWAYTDFPFNFNIEKHLSILKSHKLEPIEPYTGNPPTGNPPTGNPPTGNQLLIRLKENNTKEKNTNSIDDGLFSKEIQPKKLSINQFENFWNIYPKKAGKGSALISWMELCSQKSKDKIRPTFEIIEKAINSQIKSEQWSIKEYIPNPTTWINQCRWLDDHAEMKLYSREKLYNNKPDSVIENGETWYLSGDGKYRNKKGDLLKL